MKKNTRVDSIQIANIERITTTTGKRTWRFEVLCVTKDGKEYKLLREGSTSTRFCSNDPKKMTEKIRRANSIDLKRWTPVRPTP